MNFSNQNDDLAYLLQTQEVVNVHVNLKLREKLLQELSVNSTPVKNV